MGFVNPYFDYLNQNLSDVISTSCHLAAYQLQKKNKIWNFGIFDLVFFGSPAILTIKLWVLTALKICRFQ